MTLKIIIASTLILSLITIFSMIRAIIGPSLGDRLISINVIGTKTIVIISMISFVLRETYFIDVVLVYALISFLASIVVSIIIKGKGGEV